MTFILLILSLVFNIFQVVFFDAYRRKVKENITANNPTERVKMHLTKDKSFELCVLCSKPVSDGHIHKGERL